MLQKIKELYAVRGPLLVVGQLAVCLAPGSCSGEFTSPDGGVKRLYARWNGFGTRVRTPALQLLLRLYSRWIGMDLNLSEAHFPGAIQIVHLYHAGEHLSALARKLHPNDESHPKRWIMIHQHKLDEGQNEKLRISRITGKRGVVEANFHVAHPTETYRNLLSPVLEALMVPITLYLIVKGAIRESSQRSNDTSRCPRLTLPLEPHRAPEQQDSEDFGFTIQEKSRLRLAPHANISRW